MSKITVSLAGVDYDRTRAIFDGRVAIKGCKVVPVAMSPEEAFHRAFRHHEFDITELSLSNYMNAIAKGMSHYAAIPVFPARQFRHSSLYIRADRGIARVEDLAGKVVGVPEYQLTAAVWLRGIMQDEHGLTPSMMHWRNGGLEHPGRKQKAVLELPTDVDLQAIPAGETLSQQLDEGKIDALISPLVPSCMARNPNVRRMFPDYRAVEEAYYKRNRIFPIMHVVGIRKSLLEKHPWLAVNTYMAYLEAKQICYQNLAKIGHLFTTLPWPVAEMEHARNLMGDDYWSYGVEQNAKEIETITRYAFEQGLTARHLTAADLFVPSTLELVKV